MPDNRLVLEGAVQTLEGYSQHLRWKLEQRGAISPLRAPPLEMLEMWVTRKEVLSDGNIADLVGVLEAGPEGLAQRCGLAAGTAGQWYEEAKRLLEVRP